MNFKSGIYCGHVLHRRFTPVLHRFKYKMSMFGIDLDEIKQLTHHFRLFGTSLFSPIKFNQKDYIINEPGDLKQRIANKVNKLGGKWDGSKVFMLVQCRCLGVYFSPVNFFYCYNSKGECELMLAEVSNTPWNERHYYLIDILKSDMTQKTFHVSPFMPLNMKYKWRASTPEKKAIVSIANHFEGQSNPTFDAHLALIKKPLSSINLLTNGVNLPFMVFKILALIYWQALKLFFKRVPFVPYSKS
jgi:DUF1365 family protein